MRSLLFLSFLILLTVRSQAQTLSPVVIASGGNYATASALSLSYTIGELAAVQTFTAPSVILTQGFQQPQDNVTGLLDIEHSADGTLSVYPVPAVSTLWFGYEYAAQGTVLITLYDMTGRQMDYTFAESYSSGKVVHQFDCTPYASGNYILTAKFTSNNGEQKTISKKFQIIN